MEGLRESKAIPKEAPPPTRQTCLILKCKSNMAAQPRQMNVDEALAEIFANRDSDLSDESDQEREDVTEHSGNSSVSDD